MDRSIYFIILDIGITYEKGNSSSGLWKIGEKKRLNDEVLFWKKLIGCVREEENGTDCETKALEYLKEIAKKHSLVNYNLLLSKWDELKMIHFEIDCVIEQEVCSIMDDLLDEALQEKDKAEKYRIMRMLHNMPKCLHGANCIQPYFKTISFEDAIEYSNLTNYKNGHQ